MRSTVKSKWIGTLGKVLGGGFGLLLAGFLFFVYGILPAKVAESILQKGKVRKPLTQTPKSYGLAYQDVTFPAPDGPKISAWFIPAAGSKKARGTIVLSHGVFKNREQMLDRAELLAKSGYQVLLFDHRGCGESGDSPTSGGVLEAGDYRGAEAYLERRPDAVRPWVLFGFSLGSMSALRACAQGVAVDAVIADSPLANLGCYVSQRTSGGAFSSLPGFLSRCLSEYDRRARLDLTTEDLDLMRVVRKLPDLPLLYFTGEKDDLARPEEVRKLFETSPVKRKRLVYIPDAGHEETFEKAPLLYRRSVIDFLEDLGRVSRPVPRRSR